jgi:trk system potassium uptake protein TrkA
MRVLIVGAGDIGFQLCRRLSQENHDIIVVENDPRRVRRISEQLDVLVIEGSGTSYKVLQQAGIENVEVMAAMTTIDEVNLLACRMAKKVGVPSTIARVRNPEYALSDFILSPEELGVDAVVHPEQETADAVVRLIRQASATDAIEFEEGKIQVIGVRLSDDSPLLNLPLEELSRQHGDPPMRVAAIKRKQQTLIPDGKDELVAGDQIYAVCDPDYTEQFIKLSGQKIKRAERVMILGGGLIGRFIAQQLTGDVNVKIIESDVEKSWRIADELPNSLIIQGDGTDYDLLASEGILETDVLVAVTGDDETNIIATLLAQHLEVPRTIALVNKVQYLPITSTIGMDSVVSKQLLTVNAVQRFISHQKVVSIASLPGVDVQCIEYVVPPGSRMIGKALSKIHFPRGSLVGAVIHDDNLIIPTGATQLQADDRAVVFALPHVMKNIQKLFS